MLALMFRARTRKIRRMKQAGESKPTQNLRRVDPSELFERSQNLAVNGKPVIGVSGIRPQMVTRKPN